MSSWIQRAKKTLAEIIDTTLEECKSEMNLKARIHVIGYRDYCDARRFEVKPFHEDVSEVKDFIGSLKAQGGGDTPEDIAGALKVCLMQDWTEEANKKVFMICDAPPHGKMYHNCDDSYPEGSPCGNKIEDLMKEFKEKDIDFNCIKLNNSVNKMIEIMKQCHDECEVKDMAPQISEETGRMETDYEVTEKFKKYAADSTAMTVKCKVAKKKGMCR